MLKSLKVVLQIQEFDMKMLRLMKLRKERVKELENIQFLKNDLRKQLMTRLEPITHLPNIRKGV